MERKMKDSGVDWIGIIPNDWCVEKGKHFFAQRNTKGNESPVLLAATQKSGMIPQSLLEGVVQVKLDTDLQTFKTVHIGDFVISLRSFQGGFEMSDYEGVCSPAYQVFYNTQSIYRNYYKYLFKSYGFISKMNSLVVGIREGKNIQYKDFAESLLPIPPLPTQQRIADFLDRKCAEIDELAALQETMIAELKRYKQSVITEAVTKGLDPDVPMKDSGVEWIGEIPEGWGVCRIKDVLVRGKDGIKIGPFGSSLTNKVDDNGQYKIYGQWNIVNKDFTAGKNFITAETFNELCAYHIVSGDILVSMMGTIGKCSVIPVGIPKGIMDSHVIKIRLNNKLIGDEFFEYIYDKDNSLFVFEQLGRVKKGSIMDGLNSSIVKNLFLILPPLTEQRAIADYLDKKCAEIDELIAIKQQKIEALKEYKKSVIFEYVTGKKEVEL